MRLEELKRGFWGYRKDAVFQYIIQQEEAFSQKMLEKDAQLERMSRQDQARLRDLEAENSALKEELAKLRERQHQISQAILDARSSAEALRAESQAQEETARKSVRKTLERDLAELAGYREKIASLREVIQTTMAGLEQKAEEMELQVEKLYEAAPAGNLTLFQ